MSGSIPKSVAIGTIPVEATKYIDTGHEVLLHDSEQCLAIARFYSRWRAAPRHSMLAEATKLFDPADERDEIAKANTNQNYI
jgi:hypothetical protein